MSKTTLTSLGLKKLSIKTVEINFNGAPIEVKTYMSTPMKFTIINDTITLSMINGIFNPVAIDAVFHAMLVQHMTNISYSKGQQEHLIETYDLINESGLLQLVCDALGDVYDDLVEDLMTVLDKVENKQRTLIEQLSDGVKTITEALSELNNLDEDSVALVKDVVSKLEVAPKQ